MGWECPKLIRFEHIKDFDPGDMWSFHCPRCDSKKTYYSCAVDMQCWHCTQCGLLFTVEEAIAFQQLRENDEEEQNDYWA